ncbi:MAG TPA: DNA translocase FtsK 4TM domain-containing protein [Bacillota bacterium]|nr:DNA translocase FtsK 4TM domain-containing protein [Bacillota bacterium]
MAKPQEAKNRIKFELTGIALIALGALTWISLTTTKAGTLGGWMAYLLRELSGRGSILIPMGLTLGGLQMMIAPRPYKTDKKLYGMVIICLIILGLFQLNLPTADFFDQAARAKGGGWLGALVTFLLVKAFGRTGAYIVLFSSGLGALLVITNKSLAEAGKKSVEKFTAFLRAGSEAVSDFVFEVVDEEEEKRGEAGKKLNWGQLLKQAGE